MECIANSSGRNKCGLNLNGRKENEKEIMGFKKLNEVKSYRIQNGIAMNIKQILNRSHFQQRFIDLESWKMGRI